MSLFSPVKWILRSFIALLILAVSPVYAADEDFRAGFSAIDIATDPTISLGGYGFGARRMNPFNPKNLFNLEFRLFKPAVGQLDPLRIKTAVLTDGNKKMAWISVDTVGITQDFHDTIVDALRPLGYDENSVLISATHTHSGPGNLTQNFFWQIAAMDWFKNDFYRHIVDSVRKTVVDAELSAVPSELHSLRIETQGLQRNRRQAGAPVDSQARVLLFREKPISITAHPNSQKWIGSVVNYAIHGTAHGSDSLYFSADIPGAIETRMQEALGVPVTLFVNGAQGDVAPIENEASGIDHISRSFVQQVVRALPLAHPINPQWKIQTVSVQLPSAAISLSRCTSFETTDRRLASTHSGFSIATISEAFGETGSWLSIPLSRWITRDTHLWKIDLGEISILTWPGEPTTSVGEQLHAIAQSKGWGESWIFALTNDYHAYFTSESEFKENTYESCFSLHGGNAARSILNAYSQL